jgi:hypothetical protein
VVFVTSELSPASHTCTVQYNGNASTPALAIDHIFLNTTSILTSAPSLTSSAGTTQTFGPQSPSTSPPAAPSKKGVNVVGPVVGGVIGGVVIASLILFFIFRRRRRKSSDGGAGEIHSDSPSPLTPFSTTFGGHMVTSKQSPSPEQQSFNNHGVAPNSGLVPLRKPETTNQTPPNEFESSRQPFRHEDSGIRVSSNDRGSQASLPPLYSAA